VPATPQFYTPRHLAERILSDRDVLEGERKQVTVLFADLKGSMELMADRDPEEARRILDPVLERMMEAVHRYEGTVNQVMGDGIMALFGAPLALEDHAMRACYAALRMQASVAQYAAQVHQTHGALVQIRVGLNSGEVVVRSIGSDLRMDYTAVGQTTHLAGRMEQLARPGSILLAPTTLALAEDYITVQSLGPRPVKGLETPVQVYELTGASTTRSRLQAAAGRGLTRFVGRDGELHQLNQALEVAGGGQGQVVAIVGEPGVGKSRLTWEFTHSHRTQGWLIIEARSVSYGRATPYLPVVELLREYFRIDAHDDARTIREKVTGRLLTLDRALEPALPAFLWLLDVPVDDATWERLEPQQRRQRTLDSVKRLLLRESRAQPAVVVFEDLHWIDAETQALLDSLVESLPTARMVLVVNYRPEYRHVWSGKSYYRLLRIDPLRPASATELLGSLLGADRSLDPLKQLIVERTEGNPFFIEESVRTLIETGVLAGERGAFTLAGSARTLTIPATATAILAARIDRLPAADKRLLQAASVIGKDVPFALLERIADMDSDALGRGLLRLQAAEFLYEAQLFPELEYTFKHALTHQVAYGSLLLERRRSLHSRIVEELERLYADRLAEQVEPLAEHALQGEIWEKAFHYLRQAGTRVMERSAHREAVQYLERALGALHHLPPTISRTEEDIEVRFLLRTALLPLGDTERTLTHLREAARLAEEVGDDRRLGWASAYLTVHHGARGTLHSATASGRRALQLGAATNDVRLSTMARFFLGIAHHCLGDYADAIENFQDVIALLAPRPDEWCGEPGPPSVFARGFLAWSLAERGQFDTAMTVGDEGLRQAEAVEQPFTLMHGYFVGIAYLERGDLGRAIPLLERGFDLCRVTDLHLWTAELGADLAYAYALAARHEDAVPILEATLAEATTTDLRYTYARQHARMGEAHWMAGRVSEAQRLAGRALEVARSHRQLGQEALALHLCGLVAADVDAEAHFSEALRLASSLGMQPLVARCHLELGKLHRRHGKAASAADHIAAARRLFEQMAMGLWLERAREV
jgi:class 3 adenylate cyclase/tetratricopeptide (TPR) repeat protein